MAKILLVDDDEGVRTTLSILLNFSHQVKSAENAFIALDLLQQNTFDCLISDIKMPGMSGIELLEQVKQKYSQIPVILISGHLDINREEVLKMGARGILWKPFDIADLEEAIKHALN